MACFFCFFLYCTYSVIFEDDCSKVLSNFCNIFYSHRFMREKMTWEEEEMMKVKEQEMQDPVLDVA